MRVSILALAQPRKSPPSADGRVKGRGGVTIAIPRSVIACAFAANLCEARCARRTPYRRDAVLCPHSRSFRPVAHHADRDRHALLCGDVHRPNHNHLGRLDAKTLPLIQDKLLPHLSARPYPFTSARAGNPCGFRRPIPPSVGLGRGGSKDSRTKPAESSRVTKLGTAKRAGGRSHEGKDCRDYRRGAGWFLDRRRDRHSRWRLRWGRRRVHFYGGRRSLGLSAGPDFANAIRRWRTR